MIIELESYIMRGGRGIPQDSLEWLKSRYSACFSHEIPPHANCYMIDGNAILRNKPDNVISTDHLQQHFTRLVSDFFNNDNLSIHCIVLMFDRVSKLRRRRLNGPSSLQDLIYKWRSEEIEKEFPHSSHGSYINIGSDRKLPEPWLDYISNPILYTRELLPLICNGFFNPEYFSLKPGKFLVFWGLPFQKDDAYGKNMHHLDGRGFQYIKATGLLKDFHLIKDDKLLERIGIMFTTPELINMQRPPQIYDMWSYDAPIDNCLMVPFHLFKFLRQYHICILTDNTEILPIALGFCKDMKGPGSFFLDIMGQKTDCFIDIHKMFRMIRADQSLFGPIVQNRLISLLFLLSIHGCNFNPIHDPDYNMTNNPTTVATKLLRDSAASFEETILSVFISNTEAYSHLFQLSLALKQHESQIREPVLDEECFVDFILKVLSSVDQSDQSTKSAALNALDALLFGRKSNITLLPSNDQIRRFARLVLYTVQWWLNGYREPLMFSKGTKFDLAKTVSGEPYYGFVENDNVLKFSPTVSVMSQKVAYCYLRHFARERKRSRSPELYLSKKARKRMKQTIEDWKKVQFSGE